MTALSRAKAGVSLALAIVAGLGGSAAAAPADRGGDAVVLKGSEIPGALKVAPELILGFRWTGSWKQIPVQVDERHTIDVRRLYPPGTYPPYVGNDDPDFDLEVYTDPKTRSGVDPDAGFDADDELVFMGGDSGRKAPKGIGAPPGVVPGSGTLVTVNDPVGGAAAFVYLFRAAGRTDQSAGKDYVDYDFKLTSLTGGQTLLDDYGYIHSTNPEDSTVSTDNYELHSFDRWMEDELKVKAGNASRADILDREVTQATLFSCVRSEYTFSGRWTEDAWGMNDTSTDDEGTYVAVIDGPVRAIRSYMGANSGPYVQREHIYYRDHELNTIFLRVHEMTDIYAWTDYSPAAIGMTYRDMKNTGGVPVDGNPDSLVPVSSEEVTNGAYAWQQLSGPQGSVSTVVGADTNVPDPAFGTYYLDDATPTGLNEAQCGGDGQSIGASGFGILGPAIPNTDPREEPHNDLTVKRTRYFGPPGDGAAEAGSYATRVSKPLAGTAASSPMKKVRTGLNVKLVNRKVKAVRGKKVKLRLRVLNTGNVELRSARVCIDSSSIAGRPCVKTGRIAFGKARNFTVRAKVRKRARGKRVRLGFSYSGQAGGYGISGAGSGPSITLRR